jgi:hypothetical protein
VICKPCRNTNHANCPELARQMSSALNGTEKAGSRRCTCQHQKSYAQLIREQEARMAASIVASSGAVALVRPG